MVIGMGIITVYSIIQALLSVFVSAPVFVFVIEYGTVQSTVNQQINTITKSKYTVAAK